MVSTFQFKFPKYKHYAAATNGLLKNWQNGVKRKVTYHAREELARRSAHKMWLDEDGKVTVYIVRDTERDSIGFYIPQTIFDAVR